MITGVDHHIGGIGSMYELIAQNQKGKPGYETWINNRVVTVGELLRDAGYHTYLSGKWHPSGNNFENGTWPHDRGFEKALLCLTVGVFVILAAIILHLSNIKAEAQEIADIID